MITGFNTDIVFQGVTYHVQTEDKGVKTPLILSLVYDRGTILASKRSPYDDLLVSDFNEKDLEERLHRQHKLICAAVRAGRIEDLRQMTLKESAAKQKAREELKEAKSLASAESKAAKSDISETKQVAAPPEEKQRDETLAENKKADQIHKKPDDIPAPQLLKLPFAQEGQPAAENEFSIKPENLLEAGDSDTDVLEIPISVLEDLIIEDVEIVEEEVILAADVVDIIADPEEKAEPLQEPVDESLKIELLNDVAFKSGERKTLSVVVKRGGSETGLGGAHVMVKILGSSFRPVVFHAKTDSNGVAIINLHLPQFSRGRAAVLIRAMSGGEETELRRIISQD